MSTKSKRKFAWLPKKLTGGTWVWLSYYEHTIISEPTPMMKCIFDPDYLKTCMDNLRNWQKDNDE